MASTQAREAFYQKAWGRPWPQSSDTIYQSEIVPDTNAMTIDDDDDDDDGYGCLVDLGISPKLDYLYFLDMKEVARALGLTKGLQVDVLVVLQEYLLLHKMIETKEKEKVDAMVLAGHPGTGKTTFLLYLLLRRLEKQLPTAVQFDDTRYYIFDEAGSTVHTLQDLDQESRLRKCWALADSNSNSIQPCQVFRSHSKLLIQATSPKLDRWKDWQKEDQALLIFSDLPKVMEIGAILKATELQIPPSSTLSLVRKWGPSIRTIVAIIKGVEDDESLKRKANEAAQTICEDPKSLRILTGDVGGATFSKGSTLVFAIPCRQFAENGDILKSMNSVLSIPTKFLAGLFEGARSSLSNENSLKLFEFFSSHSYTRSPAGWGFEKLMHRSLVVGRETLTIFRETEVEHMSPPTTLLTGTLASLKNAPVSSFYWIPAASNFPGIDSVVCNNGNVYALQATIADEHCEFTVGLAKLWKNVGSVRQNFHWHYVVVTRTRTVAEGYLADDITIGSTRGTRGTPATVGKAVKVWGCVIDK